LLTPAPALIGAFAGAPVLAREMETGTFRYAWTQGFGRWRWTLGKLVPLAVAVAAAAGALSVLSWWYFQPFFAAHFGTPLAPALFDLRGVAYAAWTLAAFSIAALAGMLIRRVVPAMAATLAVYLGLALVPGLWLRQHYLAPLLTTSNTLPGYAWIMNQWFTKGGRFAFAVPQKSGTIAGLIQQHCPSASPSETLGQCLARHGYTQWTSYQPVTRFWAFQWIEGGWLLALSVLLIAATVWLVRRRAT
jgi:ABC-2 family transporter protein